MFPTSDMGGFPRGRQRVTDIVRPGTVLPGVNSFDIPNIPQDFDALRLTIRSASSDTATRSVQMRWSADGSTFFSNGVYGHDINNTTVTASANGGSLINPTTMTAAESFTAVIWIENYTTPNFGLEVHAIGLVGAVAWTGRTIDLFRTPPLVALRIFWNSTGVFDGGTYELAGVNYY